MKIYLLGVNGMLGSHLFLQFKKNNFIIRGSLRGNKVPKLFKKYSNDIDLNVDIINLSNIKKNLSIYKPNIIINCIGITKQKITKNTPLEEIFYINTLFPHKLNFIANKIKSKLIHFSTDCVFSGKRGNYSPRDIPDSEDIYGVSKYLGEITKKACTIRTSIIGHEIDQKFGLLEWFLAQKKYCVGYSKAFFSGLTTLEVFNFLKIVLNKNFTNGLYHVSSKKISKFHLLKIIKKIYKKKIIIKNSDKLKIDRSLKISLDKKISFYKVPSWNYMIQELYKFHIEKKANE